MAKFSRLLPLDKGSRRVYMLCIFFGLGSFLWGYNIGIIAPIFVAPGFKVALWNPSSQTLGLITAIYYLGTWTSYIFLSGFVNDRLGRRYASFTGTTITCIGAALEAGAHGNGALAMMICGRIISGVGNAIISTSVPLYQSEISRATQRGGLVVMNHIGLTTGLSAAFWVGYGMSHWSKGKGFDLSWRLAIAVQFIPAVLFLIGLPFVPETPRWLVEKGLLEDAQKSLEYLRGGEQNSLSISDELGQIKDNINFHKSMPNHSWTVLLTDMNLFQRLWRVGLLQFMAQMCGATAIKYYLPMIFLALGLSQELSLLASGIESTLKVGCTIIEMLIIDKVGRKISLILGCAIMAISLLINGALPLAYPNNANRAADYTCVIFIFFYSFGYSIGFGPNAWVYGTEIFPTFIRAKGLNISASGGAIGSIITAQAWPVAMQNIGSQTYFIFMIINLGSIAILAAFYPETKGRTLEQVDEIFGRLIPHPPGTSQRINSTVGPDEIDDTERLAIPDVNGKRR